MVQREIHTHSKNVNQFCWVLSWPNDKESRKSSFFSGFLIIRPTQYLRSILNTSLFIFDKTFSYVINYFLQLSFAEEKAIK